MISYIYILSYTVQEPPIANAERSMVEAEPIASSTKNDKVFFFMTISLISKYSHNVKIYIL
jgi:hypothetical protein